MRPSIGNTIPPLKAETYHDARNAAPSWDVYHLEQQWREWVRRMIEEDGMGLPRSPDAAFLGFCRKWYKERGTA